MKIGFIGAGKVGKSFGCYFKKNNLSISGYFSRSVKSSNKATVLTHSFIYHSLEELINTSDIIFITTPDDIIESIAIKIASIKKEITNKTFVHMSGVHTSSTLSAIKETHPNTNICSLHPLQAFADINQAILDLENTYFSIEGDSLGKKYLINIISKCNNHYFILEKENKSLYHASACIISNYLVTLIDYGLKLLKFSGINPEEGFEAMLPLIKGSLNNIKNLGTAEALTGPIVRGDIKTIANHIKAIDNNNLEMKKFYCFLGKETTKLVQSKSLKNTNQVNILNQLWKEGEK